MTYSSRVGDRRRVVPSIVEQLEARQLLHAGHDHTIRIEAGSSSPYTDSQGHVWQADTGFTGGGVDTKSFTVANTPDPKLYTTRRAGVFGYTIPTDDGAYTLNLLFADWVTTAGTRKFNVSAEGQPILTNFDIAASGGGQKALVKSLNVNVTGGALDLAFTKLVGNPVVSAIELIPVTTTPTPPSGPVQLSASATSSSRIILNWTDTASNETAFEIERSTDGGTTFAPLVTLSGSNHTSHADDNLTPSTKYVYRVRAINGAGPSSWSNVAEATTAALPSPPPGGLTTLRVDAAGSKDFIDSTGKVWSKEFGFSGGGPNTGLFAVSGTVDDALYATRRTGEFTFSAPATTGDYTLRLLFTDYYAPGKRRFNVIAEGQQILSNFDISAEAGINAALVKTFNVKVTDGTLNLAFKNVLGNASLSALELVPAEPVVLPATPSNLIATGKTGGKAELTWSDNSNNETNFEIWRATNGGTRALVATLGANVTSWTDSGLSPANTYTYWVRATNAAGPSDYSNPDNATPLDGAATDTWTKITWTTAAPSPINRSESGGGMIAGKLYVFGGFSGNAGPVTRSDVYDPAANTWTRIADMPTRLTHAGTVIDGRSIYFAGGYIGTGTGYTQVFATRDVWRYDIDGNSYTHLPDLPEARGAGGLAMVGRKLHYFGGGDLARADRAEHFVLNLDNLPAGWTTAAPLPMARTHIGFASLNGKIYAIGGHTDLHENLVPTTRVDMFDPATGVWQTIAALPAPTSHIAASTFVMGGRIIVAGGERQQNQWLSEVLAYDPVTNQWTQLSPLPGPRFSGVAGTVNGVIYFTTGSSQTTTWKGVPG